MNCKNPSPGNSGCQQEEVAIIRIANKWLCLHIFMTVYMIVHRFHNTVLLFTCMSIHITIQL